MNKMIVGIKIDVSHEKWLLKFKHITDHENTAFLIK
jgi:hypothetical protein